ncbi:MAG: DUF6067 family protein [Phycisphaerae bacterium]
MRIHRQPRIRPSARFARGANGLFILAAAGVYLLAPGAATATDTAFWKPYASDTHTYALIHFDAAAPLSGAGTLVGAGEPMGDAALEPEGRFGGGLRVGDGGFARFPTKPLDPNAMAIHGANHTLSLEGWVHLKKYPAAEERAYVLFRPDSKRKAIGFSLFVTSEGALGMSATPCGSRQGTQHTSPEGVIPVGEWTHVAGVFAGGHLSVGRDRLFVNGTVVADFAASGAAGTEADIAPAPICVGGAPEGGCLTGVIDEVRVHGRVGCFWPLDPMPWIDRIAEKGLPPLEDVLEPDRQPRLLFYLDEDTRPTASPALRASDPAIVERFDVSFKGDRVPGVKGKAVNGDLRIGGFRLADWRAGSLEFWFRPRGVNSISDRNVRIVRASGLVVCFFNTVRANRPVSFYYQDAEGNLRVQGADVEVHPGRWHHMALTWDAQEIVMYMNGERVAAGENAIPAGRKGMLDEIDFTPQFDIDELCFYEHRLSAGEVANRYWSYVDPEKMTPAEPPAPVYLSAWRLPSENAIYYTVSAKADCGDLETAAVRLVDDDGREILSVEGTLDGAIRRIETPDLPDGVYMLRASVMGDGKTLHSTPVAFLAASFAWEDNQLGVTDEVFPPYEPIRVENKTVSVVLRDYRMNGFGLWDSAVSQGRELLAAPVRLHCQTADGEACAWTFSEGEWAANQPHRAAYHARAACPAATVETVSEIEMDGMMKVTMRLAPGRDGKPIERLWLDMPLRASEATLMHEDTGTLRYNYSGIIPDGQGTVWRSHRTTFRGGWRNAFTGYVWAGGEERGVAWFAENDKGWITEKNLSDKPLQEIVRDGDTVVIRVHLVNTPAVIDEEREIVFGLQASPAKPMPDDWRTGARGGGLPVTAWGGHQCADKFPFKDDWAIVDKIIEQQRTGKDNKAWFEQYQKEHDVPPLRGTSSWVRSIMLFARRSERPTMTYFEEMAAPTYRNDWRVYKDEWNMERGRPRRELADAYTGPRESWPDGYDIFRRNRHAGARARVNFIDSYRDYGAYYANEWLKRGVGIYWDNTYLTAATNPLTSAAYKTEDGHIQPGLTLWNQREYAKRVWNLMHHWRRKRGEKLLFLQHMTNTNLLPILAWCTTSFDNEFSAQRFAQNVNHPQRHDPNEPFPPDYLRAQSTGRQTGNYPALCHGLFRMDHLELDAEDLPPEETDRVGDGSIFAQKREWGMRRVHEIPPRTSCPAVANLEKTLRGFGYDTPAVEVHNYWAETPAVTTDREDVKWLLLARPADRRLFLVLQSWSRKPAPVKVGFDAEVIGFKPGGHVVDLETCRRFGALRPGGVTLEMKAPYDLKVLGVGEPELPASVVFRDEFNDGPSPRWTNLNSVSVRDGALRFGKNTSPWRGPVRIEMWQGMKRAWQDATLDVVFRLSTAPEARMNTLVLLTRATAPGWSEHGLTHTRLGRGCQAFHLRAGPEGEPWELVRTCRNQRGGRRGNNIHRTFGTVDGKWHTLTVVINGPKTTVRFDGEKVADYEDAPADGMAFGLHGAKGLSDAFYVDVDHVTLYREEADRE